MIWNNSLLFLHLNEDLESSIFTMRSNLPVFHHNTVRMVILSNSPTCKHTTFGYVLQRVGGAALFFTKILNLSLSLFFFNQILSNYKHNGAQMLVLSGNQDQQKKGDSDVQ